MRNRSEGPSYIVWARRRGAAVSSLVACFDRCPLGANWVLVNSLLLGQPGFYLDEKA